MRRAGLLLAALVLGGCAGELAFTQDDRLQFLTPPERAEVRGPVLIEWRMRRPDPGSVFAVFVDRPPMRPGRDVRSLAEDDRLCAVTPGCPDREWLAQQGVYLTRRPRLALAALPEGHGRDAGSRERHEITVVLVDGRGVRRTEAAWTRVVYAR